MSAKKHLGIRLSALFQTKSCRRLPAVLLTEQPDVFYFTGFTGGDSWAVLTPRKATIITDGRYALQARQQAPNARTVVRRDSIVACLAAVLKKSAIRRIGFIADQVAVGLHDKLTQACKRIIWRPAHHHTLLELRQIKSPPELARIRKALAVAQSSFRDLLNDLKPGLTERQVAADLEYRMRSAGADKSAFDIIVACGKNAAKPHATTTSAKLTAGKPIVIDFGAAVGQYCCDLTRTVWLGKMSKKFRDIYKICLEAQAEAIAAVKPGVRASDVDKIARTVISRAKCGKYFVHSLGHGFGLDVHEWPVLQGRSETVLQPGMVVTVEPGIYVPSVGGVRIEDNVLVTARGCTVLSDLPKCIDDVIL